MVDVKELRVGNCVTLSDKTRSLLFRDGIKATKEYFEVDAVFRQGDVMLELDDEVVDLDHGLIEPIPITEEWLIKFGFEKMIYPFDMYELNKNGLEISFEFKNKVIIGCYFESVGLDIKIMSINSKTFVRF